MESGSSRYTIEDCRISCRTLGSRPSGSSWNSCVKVNEASALTLASTSSNLRSISVNKNKNKK